MEGGDTIIVVAMTANRVIGRQGRLPWYIPEDLALFRRLTLGHTLVMGRRTFESIGHPLDGRINIVVSRTLGPVAGISVCADFSTALRGARQRGGKTFIIGGREIYRQALPLAGWMSVSWIKQDVPGDCRFPDYRLEDWQVVYEQDYEEFRHVLYRRR